MSLCDTDSVTVPILWMGNKGIVRLSGCPKVAHLRLVSWGFDICVLSTPHPAPHTLPFLPAHPQPLRGCFMDPSHSIRIHPGDRLWEYPQFKGR